jgi:hypothetical protein
VRDGAGVDDDERVAAEPTYVDPGGAVREGGGGGGGGESLDRELDELDPDELDPEEDDPVSDEPDELDPELDEPDDELDEEPPLRGTACWADAHAGVAIVKPTTKTAMRADFGMVGSRSPADSCAGLDCNSTAKPRSRKCHNLREALPSVSSNWGLFKGR